MLTAPVRAHFETFGFVVLRAAFEPGPLADEIDRAFRDAFGASRAEVGFVAGQSGSFLPTMGPRTPVALTLLDRFEPLAAALLGREVLPVRAKTVRYAGATGWHTDSTRDVASLGFAAYLESLRAENGALRVLPASHRAPLSARAAEHLTHFGDPLPGHVVATDPGDVIVFDEHLFHASSGGRDRRQWRVDYVGAPRDEAESERVRAYYAGLFPTDWEGGYDVDLFPSYGPDWRASGRAAVGQLAALGVYAASDAHENFARARRSSRRDVSY